MSDDPKRFDVGGVSVHINQAPPVYDPGGPVAFIGTLPGEVEPALLTKAETEAARRGAVLMVVQCTVAETAQEALLLRSGYSFASSWYSGPLAALGSGGDGSIRAATAADVPRILEIGERKREQYASFSPVFWRKASVPRETFGPFITSQVESRTNVALVFGIAGEIKGYLISQCRNLADGYVDDYALANPSADWPMVGVALLSEAGRLAHKRGVTAFTIVTGHADTPKRDAVEKLGFTLGKNWLVKPLRYKHLQCPTRRRIPPLVKKAGAG